MMSYVKSGIFLVIVLVGGYFAWQYKSYYGADEQPVVEVVGIQADQGFSGDIKATIKGSDSYKVASLQVNLDNEPWIKTMPIGRRSFTHELEIATKELKQGHHKLSIVVESAGHKQLKTDLEIPFMIDRLPLQAALTKNEVDAQVYQGRTLHIEFQANKEIKQATVKTLSVSYPCYLKSNRGYTYECFVPIECEEVAQEYPYTVELIDWAGATLILEGKFKVVAFPFKKQALRVDKEKIQQENKLGLPEKQLEADIVELTKKSPQKKLWQGRFVVPLELTDKSQVTSDFGVIRATQERGLSQHKALDLIAYPKSVVWAPQDGRVVLKARYAHSGNTIGIDHGYGLLSLFFHLDSFADINVGDAIKKGQPLGTVGKTGYATGYHLHWEMRVNTVPVDPFEWTKENF